LVAALGVGSMISAVWIQHARLQVEQALREARLAQAKAVRRTNQPGRRAEAFAAIAEAARIRPGSDLRDEALAALLLPDVRVMEKWDLALGVPSMITFDPAGQIAAVELRTDPTGQHRDPSQLRHWANSAPFGSLIAPANPMARLCFSDDGALVLARFLDGALRIWRVGEGKPFLILTNSPSPSPERPTEEFNNDYDFLLGGKSFVLGLPAKGVSLLRVADGSEIARWEGGDLFQQLKVSPDGKHVAATRVSSKVDARIFLLDLPDLTLNRVLTLTASPQWLAWSSDSRVLAVPLSNNTISLFDIRDGRLLRNLVCPGLGPGEISFLGRDSFIAVRGTGTTLRLVNTVTGGEELVIQGYGPASAAVKPGGESFVVTTVDAIATRWEIVPPTGFRILPAPSPDGYDMTVNNSCIDFSPDGRWMLTSHGRYTLLREVATGRLADELDSGDPHALELADIAFCEGGKQMLRCSTRTGLERRPLVAAPSGLPSFGPAQVLDAETGFIITDHTPDGTRLALIDPHNGRMKMVRVDAAGSKVLSRWTTTAAYSGSLSPDGERLLLNCAATGTNGPNYRIRVHRFTDGAVLSELPASVSCDTAWSADGKLVMTSNGQKQSTLWDVASWSQKVVIKGSLGGDLTTFGLAPDGSYAVVCQDDRVALLSTRDGSVLASFECAGSSGLAAGVRFLPDGRTFAVLWRDGRVDLVTPDLLRSALAAARLAW